MKLVALGVSHLANMVTVDMGLKRRCSLGGLSPGPRSTCTSFSAGLGPVIPFMLSLLVSIMLGARIELSPCVSVATHMFENDYIVPRHRQEVSDGIYVQALAPSLRK